MSAASNCQSFPDGRSRFCRAIRSAPTRSCATQDNAGAWPRNWTCSPLDAKPDRKRRRRERIYQRPVKVPRLKLRRCLYRAGFGGRLAIQTLAAASLANPGTSPRPQLPFSSLPDDVADGRFHHFLLDFVLPRQLRLGSFADSPSATKEFPCPKVIAKRRNRNPIRAKSSRHPLPRRSEPHPMREAPSANKIVAIVTKPVSARGLFMHPSVAYPVAPRL